MTRHLLIGRAERNMHLNGLHRLMKSFYFPLNYFVLKYYFKAFYRYIYHISEPVSSCRVSVHHWSALIQNGQKVHSLFSYFIKAQCWYCECTQIKVDPLQFQMIYYSYLYEKKITRRILSCFYCKKKIQVTTLEPPCPVKLASASTLHTNCWILHIYIG